MDKLKTILKRYPHWKALEEYIERIEVTRDRNFPACIGNSKSLLETVGKEICDKQKATLTKKSSVHGVIGTAFSSLGISNSDPMRQISSSLINIGRHVGNLRNTIDTNAHGKTLSELKQQKKTTEEYTANFLIHSVDIVVVFLIETFEQHRVQKEIEEQEAEVEEVYLDFEDFNATFDEENGEVLIGDYEYQPSEVLFYVDRKAFETEYNLYLNNQPPAESAIPDNKPDAAPPEPPITSPLSSGEGPGERGLAPPYPAAASSSPEEE